MDVFSYLYLPIEHVVNLAAKIEAIYDHTPKFHDQYDNWLDAYEKIMKLSSQVDRWKGTCGALKNRCLINYEFGYNYKILANHEYKNKTSVKLLEKVGDLATGSHCFLYVFHDVLILAKYSDVDGAVNANIPRFKEIVKLIRLDDSFVVESFVSGNSSACMKLKQSIGDEECWVLQLLGATSSGEEDGDGESKRSELDVKQEMERLKDKALELKREITHLVVHLNAKPFHRKSTYKSYLKSTSSERWEKSFLKIKSASKLLRNSSSQKLK